MSQKFIDITSQDFKTHFAQYVRLLEKQPDTALIIHKYKKPIGIFAPIKAMRTDDDSSQTTKR